MLILIMLHCPCGLHHQCFQYTKRHLDYCIKKKKKFLHICVTQSYILPCSDNNLNFRYLLLFESNVWVLSGCWAEFSQTSLKHTWQLFAHMGSLRHASWKITQLDSCSEIDTCSPQTRKVLLSCDISDFNVVRCHKHESSLKQHSASNPLPVMRWHFIILDNKLSRLYPKGKLLLCTE